MKNIILIAAALFITIAANAQRGNNRTCTINLEREAYRGTGYRFVQSFTELGRFACDDARRLCQQEKSSRAFSYEYRCEEDYSSEPRDSSCEYRIETRRGFTSERFTATGFRSCEAAEDKCEDELEYQRRWGMVGSDAVCVKTSVDTRPSPRPVPRPRPAPTPRLVTETCRAELLAGRIGRPTGNVYTGQATARNYTEARQRACNEALNICNAAARGTMRCEVIR